MIVLANQCHTIMYEKLAHFQLENPIDFQCNKRKPIEEHKVANVIFQLISENSVQSPVHRDNINSSDIHNLVQNAKEF